jgi:hypothetical protein
VPFPVRLGFDHYTVDFCDPTDYLQRNAYVLIDLIQDIRVTLLDSEEFGIAGNSMGGLVSRYALTLMEAEGIDPRVDLWITNDTPHKGAYIPLSVQFLAELAEAIPSLSDLLEDALEPVKLADSISARQMLLAHHEGFPVGQPHSDHGLFFQELASYGNFPSTFGLRSVAIASGAGAGRAVHRVEGVTWRLPVPEVKHTVPIDFLGLWKTSITFSFRGNVVVRLIPLTQTRQAVLRVTAEGPVLINGTKIADNADTLTAAGVASVLGTLLRKPDWVPSSILASIATLVMNCVTEMLQPFRSVSTISTAKRDVLREPPISRVLLLPRGWQARALSP